MAGNLTGRSWKSRAGLCLTGMLAAVAIYVGAAIAVAAAAGAVRPGVDRISARQVVLSGVLILGPVTTLFILEN